MHPITVGDRSIKAGGSRKRVIAPPTGLLVEKSSEFTSALLSQTNNSPSVRGVPEAVSPELSSSINYILSPGQKPHPFAANATTYGKPFLSNQDDMSTLNTLSKTATPFTSGDD